MKQRFVSLLIAVCLFTNFPAFADYTPNPDATSDQNTTGPLQTLVLYLGNLGRYLGYDLETNSPPEPQNNLIGYSPENAYSTHKIFEALLYYSVYAALPVNAFETSLANFTPNNVGDLNGYANFTFLKPSPYNSANASTLSVIKDIDQQPPQNDPVNQATLNIIGTPDISFCGQTSNSNNCLSQQDVTGNILKDIVSSEGILPGTDRIFTKEITQAPLSQLNPNTLLAPLVYTTQGDGGGSNESKGLPKNNQEQQAADFIRYATAQNLTIGLIDRDAYDKLWSAAFTTKSGEIQKNTTAEGIAAQQALTQYLLALRMYAAQSAVATSNLYAILSKRIPQQAGSDPNNATSQALNEFKMATWRLKNPDPQVKDDNQWIDQINKASPATIQKEMAVLLSEINYQLYLNRQQQERLLLTNSMILLQTLTQNKPEVPSPEDLGQSSNSTSAISE